MTEHRSDQWHQEYRHQLTELRAGIRDDPQSNPVAALAFRISRDLESGNRSLADLDGLVKRLSEDAFRERAKRLAHYLDLPKAGDEKQLRAFIRGQAQDGALPFTDFQALWLRAKIGIVFTAHPTFAISEMLSNLLAKTMESFDDPERQRWLEGELAELPHRNQPTIDIAYEHRLAQATIAEWSAAYTDSTRVLLEETAALYPDNWREMRTELATCASWVGYDLDGRTDIQWWHSLRLRIAEKHAQLTHYRDAIQHLARANTHDPGAVSLVPASDLLDAAITVAEGDIRAFSSDIEHAEILAPAANRLTDGNPRRLTSRSALLERLNDAAVAAKDDTFCREVMVLRDEVANVGLGTAHIHLRINAAQLHNAIRKVLDIDDLENPSRLLAARLSELIHVAEPEAVNFASLLLERATAKRQFIMLAQILKHVDSDTPVRFLIAECEQPLTVLTALYFAKQFGIDDRIDISPLFETADALERGARLVDQLLETQAYRDYIHTRGRLSIQTGFSDAGRYVGQITATLAIERLHMKLARLLKERGLTDVEVVIFNTHGESVGRGSHPASLQDRLSYVLSPTARRLYQEAGIPLKHETSFQGGDGYLLFARPRLARATLFGLLQSAFEDAGSYPEDPFYADTDHSLDFFLRLKAWHQALFQDTDYRVLLASFGTHLLFNTGSRRSRRQIEMNPLEGQDALHLRAIPHNAILQQLGYVAHAIGGIGTATRMERERFIETCMKSPRLRSFMEMVAHIKRNGSLSAVTAYASLLDPGYWSARVHAGGEPAHHENFRHLVRLLDDDHRATAIRRAVNRLREDEFDLHSLFDAIGINAQPAPDERLDTDLLHATRIAVIMHIFLLAMRIPHFSTRDDITQEDILKLILRLDMPPALELLRVAFPVASSDEGDISLSEPATYRADAHSGYQELNETLLDGMEQAYDLTRRIGIAISHHFGAHG